MAGRPKRRARRNGATVRVTGGRTAPTARLYVKGQEEGHLQVTRIQDPFDPDADNIVTHECQADIEALIEQESDLAPIIFVAWRSGISAPYRSKGYGRLLYMEMLRHLRSQEGQPVILVPESCMEDGSTSPSAYRVWRSLKRRLPWSGEAVYGRLED